MEHLTQKQQIERIVRIAFSVGARDSRCSRPVCRRNRLCFPPRDDEGPPIYRCPYDSAEHWENRKPIAWKQVEWLMKLYEGAYKRLGKPSPFAPKQPQRFDPTKPFDLGAFLQSSPDGHRIDAGDGVPDLQSFRRSLDAPPARRRRRRRARGG